jgi:hypothetical protein
MKFTLIVAVVNIRFVIVVGLRLTIMDRSKKAVPWMAGQADAAK